MYRKWNIVCVIRVDFVDVIDDVVIVKHVLRAPRAR